MCMILSQLILFVVVYGFFFTCILLFTIYPCMIYGFLSPHTDSAGRELSAQAAFASFSFPSSFRNFN